MITIDYFSDVLCVWAYGGQIRLDELRRTFGDQIQVRHRFLSLFADTQTRIGGGWKDQGGFRAFGDHIREVCAQWPHVTLADSVWSECRPLSCTTAHVFLKAAQDALGVDADSVDRTVATGTDRFEDLVARVRTAFFADGRDIGRLDVLLDLLPRDGPGSEEIRSRIDNGAAYAELQRDRQLAEKYGVLGSPTYVFNEGRQLLYGNVGYRIIETNVRELLTRPPIEGQPSWC